MAREASSVPYVGKRGRRYYAFWYDPTSQRTLRRSLKCADPAAAERAFATFLTTEKGRLQPQGPDRYSVAQGLDDYFREHVSKECADPERQASAIVHLKAHFGDHSLEGVDIPASRAYAEARRTGKVGGGKRRPDKRGSEATIRRELVALTAAGNHAFRWKRITLKPVIELPTVLAEVDEEGLHGEAPFFTREQIEQLIDLAGQEDDSRKEMQRYIRLCYYTGARRRSIENLTVGQVSLERRKISLATPGKRQTKKRQPVVPVFTAILDDLRALMDGKKAGEKLLRPRSFYREFTMLCRALEFPEPFNPHMLRHSRATHLLQDGKDIYDVAALLGDTVATIERNYGHHRPDDLRGKLE